MLHADVLEKQLEDMTIGDSGAPPPDTPESVRFRALPQELQRRILTDYPRTLATAMHQYSNGADCETILMQLFESSSEMLRVRNTQGDAPMAVALLSRQDERAEKLVDLAHRKNPAALDSRSQYGETLLMLSTSSSSADNLMERFLQRDPTQLHRLYDLDGCNFLHHCALEESLEALDAALRVTAVLIREHRLSASQVSAAIHMNDRAGNTPMHMMASRNRRDMLARLLEFGNDVHIHINVDERQHRDRRWTPLMLAVMASAEEAVGFLMSRGADPNEEDTEGQTAVSMAAGNARILRILGATEEFMDLSQCDTIESSKADVKEENTVGWLTNGHPPVRSVDSGIGSTTDSIHSAAVDPAPDVSQEELKVWETRLQTSGKSMAFLQALNRLDSKLQLPSIVDFVAEPVGAAFGFWAANGLRISRYTVIAALREIEEC